jgi:hypothetical protein
MRLVCPRLCISLVASALAASCQFDPGGLAPGLEPPDGAPDVTDPDAPPAGPGVQRTITIDAGQVPSTLVDFPLYVAISDPQLGQKAGHDGADIHFVAADGTTRLDHELQRWDPGAGHLEAWVRVPLLASNTDTVLALRYGDPAAAAPANPTGVWRNGFAAVWHLEDPIGPGASQIRDSTGERHGTASSNLGAASRVDGALGGGLRFDGNQEITFANPLLGSSSHTLSAWVQQAPTSSHDALFVLGNGACTQARWFHSRFSAGSVAAGFYCDDWADTGANIQGAGWTLLHWSYDAQTGQSRLYRDGVLAAGPHDHLGAQATAGEAGHIGNAPGAFGQQMGFNGVLDELRIGTTARTPAWIATEHANQRDPASFYAIGAETPIGAP